MRFWGLLPVTLTVYTALANQARGSALLSTHNYYQRNATALAVRDTAAAGGCQPGFINCPVFGCIQGSACPQDCTSRKDISSCAVSINGKGCAWISETCVQNVQCPINAAGQCPDGCQGCGEFQCINIGLQCPRSCASRSVNECNTLALYNGVGCGWNGSKCIPWDPINNIPIPATHVTATQYVLTTSGAATAVPTQQAPSPTPVPPPSTTTAAPVSQPQSTTAAASVTTATTTTSIASSTPAPTTSASSTPSSLGSSSDSQSFFSSLDEGFSSSATDGSTLEASNGNSGITARHSGLGAGPIVAIVICSLAAVGLISWVVLYQMTKSKTRFQPELFPSGMEKSASAHYASPPMRESSSAIRDMYGSQVDLIATAARVAGVPRR
ncbi:hypothetical protein GQ54DRAFT_295293 [Martensiomyces pterosporus]|nr:hypothetical protein GQ54DRAFT_295293 [Martensiomyces pterosporus]